jgi:hypothetical protein
MKKKSRSNREIVCQGAAGTETCGSDRADRWWAKLEGDIDAACKRFWQATPERRKIEAARRRQEFLF